MLTIVDVIFWFKGCVTVSTDFEDLFTFSNPLFAESNDLLNENTLKNSGFDLCNINLLNQNCGVAKDALDTNRFRTPTGVFGSLMLHPVHLQFLNGKYYPNKLYIAKI